MGNGATGFSEQTAAAIQRVRRHSLGDLLHRTAVRYPGKTAVVDGDTRWTFAEFDAAVNRCAAALAEQGLAKGDRLALLSHNCRQFAVLVYATARLGVVLVPINFMLTADEVGWILGDAEPVAFVAQPEFVATALSAI